MIHMWLTFDYMWSLSQKEHALSDLLAFENSFLAGELKPWLKSEDDVPSNLKDKVKVLCVGKKYVYMFILYFLKHRCMDVKVKL